MKMNLVDQLFNSPKKALQHLARLSTIFAIAVSMVFLTSRQAPAQSSPVVAILVNSRATGVQVKTATVGEAVADFQAGGWKWANSEVCAASLAASDVSELLQENETNRINWIHSAVPDQDKFDLKMARTTIKGSSGAPMYKTRQSMPNVSPDEMITYVVTTESAPPVGPNQNLAKGFFWCN
ncbi:MAG: hypothetical protein F6K11_27650 [Leptolyngbya sp. SIO3F4]|nr:hypothetical protein [Leptolyngbya sp. SIO3F4]